jgi:signal transduction histidine kinase
MRKMPGQVSRLPNRFLRAMTYWGWVLFLGLAGSVQAQYGSGFSPLQNDSAQIALRRAMQTARHDTTRVDVWEKISTIYLNQDKPDSAFQVLQQGLRLANQSRRPLDLGRMHRGLGEYYYYKMLAPQLLDNYQKAVQFFLQAQRVTDASLEMYHVAQGYAIQTDYAKSVEACNKCLGYAQQTGYHNIDTYTYALLYTIHLQFGDKKKAFADLKAMQNVAQRHPTTLNRYLTNMNLAEWYDLQHQYAKALPYWQLTLVAAKESRVPTYVVEAYNSLATDFLKLNNFSAADNVLTKGFAEIGKSDPLSSTIYRTQALLREHQNRLPQAQQAALAAIENARKTHHPFLIKAGLETLIRLQEKQGKYQQALATSHQLTTLRDSLNEVNQIQRINEVESKLVLDKKEKDLKLLRQKTLIQKLVVEKAQQQRLLFLTISLGLTLLLLGMGWIVVVFRGNLRKLNQQQTEITNQNRQLVDLNALKDKLFSLIGHDLRTPVIDLKLSIEQLEKKPKESLEWFTNQTTQLKRTVNSLYVTLDNLLHWAALQQKGMLTQPQIIDLRELVAETVDLLESTRLRKNIEIMIEAGTALAWANDGQTQVVLRNILTNALKFTPPGGHIQISFGESTNEALVHIADTGIGMPTTDPQQAAKAGSRRGTLGETGTGIGLLVSEEFMKRNGGRLEIESNVGKGTIVTLRFTVKSIKSLA